MYSVLVPVEMQYVVTSILAVLPRQQLCALLLHALFCTPEQYAGLRITELPGTEYSGMRSGPGLYPPSGHVVQLPESLKTTASASYDATPSHDRKTHTYQQNF